MKLVVQVGLGPGHIVLDGDPDPPSKKGHSLQLSVHVYCGQTVAHLSYCGALVRECERTDKQTDRQTC